MSKAWLIDGSSRQLQQGHFADHSVDMDICGNVPKERLALATARDVKERTMKQLMHDEPVELIG